MKNALAVTGLAIVLAVLLSSPTFAQTSNQPPVKATPAPAPAVETASADVPLDTLIEEAQTPEDRARMLLRCIGPAPRPMHVAKPAKEAPASEPAVFENAH